MQTTLINALGLSGAQTVKSSWFKHGGGPLSLQLVTHGTIVGPWHAKVSNKPSVENDDDADATDVTSGFQTPAASPIVDAAGATSSQFVQTAFLKAGAIQISIVIASGAGDVLVHLGA